MSSSTSASTRSWADVDDLDDAGRRHALALARKDLNDHAVERRAHQRIFQDSLGAVDAGLVIGEVDLVLRQVVLQGRLQQCEPDLLPLQSLIGDRVSISR